MKIIIRPSSARRTLKLAQYALMTVGILAVGYCLSVLLGTELYQVGEARIFNRELVRKEEGRAAHVSTIVPVATRKHGVIGSLEIPRIGMSVMVVEGVDDSDLRHAVGHIPGTALPWSSGNVGLAGHRDALFRPLRSIHLDDKITMSTLQGVYFYRVVSTRIVRPEDIQVLYPTGHDRLTLVTCFPFEYIGSAPKRFIVRAERAQQPPPTGTTRKNLLD